MFSDRQAAARRRVQQDEQNRREQRLGFRGWRVELAQRSENLFLLLLLVLLEVLV